MQSDADRQAVRPCPAASLMALGDLDKPRRPV